MPPNVPPSNFGYQRPVFQPPAQQFPPMGFVPDQIPMQRQQQLPPQNMVNDMAQGMAMDQNALLGLVDQLTHGINSGGRGEGRMALELFDIPSNATSCLYVEGVPFDATEREVAHVFRPYPGFLTARLIPKVSKVGRKYFFCFVDFEDRVQATIAQQTL